MAAVSPAPSARTAIIRAAIFRSIVCRSSILEHADGGRTVGGAGHEAGELLAGLFLRGSVTSLLQSLGPSLRGEHRGQVGDLLRLHGEQLVAGLRRLKHADRRLAGVDQCAGLRARAFQIGDGGGARLQRVLEGGDGLLPALLRRGDELGRRAVAGGEAFRRVDRAGWFGKEEAERKILRGQLPLLEALWERLG